MPAKRNYRKRGNRKPNLRKAKRTVAKANAKAKKSNLDTYAVTIRTNGLMAAVQGVTVANYLYTTIPLLSPSLNLGITQLTEFKLYSNMYDQVRVNRVHIRVIPKANFLSLWENTDATNNTSGDGMIHSIIDRDGPGGTSIQNYLRYPSYKKHDQKKSFGRSYGVKWPTGVWLDTAQPYADITLLKQLGCLGGVYLYAENMYEILNSIINNVFADIEVSYDCVFRGKTAGAFTYDSESGGVMVTSNDVLPQLTPSPILNVRGTITDQVLNVDASGVPFETPINDFVDANTEL